MGALIHMAGHPSCDITHVKGRWDVHVHTVRLNDLRNGKNRSSIKPGTWNIPDHPETLNNYDNYEKNM